MKRTFMVLAAICYFAGGVLFSAWLSDYITKVRRQSLPPQSLTNAAEYSRGFADGVHAAIGHITVTNGGPTWFWALTGRK